MGKYFTPKDWLRVWHDERWVKMPVPSDEIVMAIHHDHYRYFERLRENFPYPLMVHRGYATVDWELKRGRDGTSQHCFKDNGFEKIGATDIDFWYKKHENKRNYLKLAQKLIDSPFKRIAWYPNLTFFHNDYKADNRQYFYNDDGWKYVDNQNDWLKKIAETWNTH